ncbi:tetratricopeptide repeat protein [Devosia sp. XK-2]|uniref:O-linked N-acetylglucosamine transferase, SPINDLY family protein n=1 Tax=Devosia sp. XK-2 TaxID=3126689 RepID=UPI0030CE9D5D
MVKSPRSKKQNAKVTPALAQLFSRADTCYRQGQLQEADRSLAQALMVYPDWAEAWHLRGLVMYSARQLAQAQACFERAIASDAKVANYHANLALVLIGQGHYEQAMSRCMAALKIETRHFGAALNLGLALYETGRASEALRAFERARSINARSPVASGNVGRAALHIGEYEKAAAAYGRAAELDRENSDYAVGNAMSLYMLGRTAQSRAVLDTAVQKWPEQPVLLSARTFVLNYFDDVGAGQQAEAAMAYGRMIEKTVGAATHIADPAQADRRVRVGFVSADLRDHSVGSLLKAVLPHLDRGRLELVAYSMAHREDATSEALRVYFDNWVKATGLDNDTLANKIRADGIDVLLDLSGHTMGNRLPLFASRPAPVSASWLGYSGTTGLSRLDYLVCDNWVLPEGEERYISERPWRLPDAFLAFSDNGAPPAPKSQRRSGPVFGSFNSHNKISDATMSTWAEILRSVPESRLLLKSRALQQKAERDATAKRFEALGVAPDRLDLMGRTETQAEHLALYGQIDIALDPFPYNGTTTTVQALRMGVPVLTLKGNRYISRVGASILANAGLDDWIAGDVADYVTMAVERAGDRDRLAVLRSELPGRIAASPICDVPRFGRDFSDMLVGMWRNWCLSQK